jgi:hypothetical protein
MNFNEERNTRIYELITTLVIIGYLVFIFIKFLYF